MLRDGGLSSTRTGKRDHVPRQRTLQPRSNSWYAALAQIVEIGQKIPLISFKPPLGRSVHEPGQKTLQVSRVGIVRLGPTREPAKPNYKCTRRRDRADSWIQIPPDPILPTLDRAQMHSPGSRHVHTAF